MTLPVGARLGPYEVPARSAREGAYSLSPLVGQIQKARKGVQYYVKAAQAT
jgi:hypothetical protein